MSTAPTLSNTKLHSPQEIAAHKAAIQQYFADKRASEAAVIAEQTKAKAHANRVLSDDEYFELNLAEDNAKKERELVKQVEELAAQSAKDDLYSSQPATVTISESNDFSFLRELQIWMRLGYEIDFDTNRYFQPNFYSLTLTKPAKQGVRK